MTLPKKTKKSKAFLPSIKRIYQRFAPYLQTRKKLIFASFAILLVETGLRLLEPWPLKFIFDHILIPNSQNSASKVIVDYGIEPMLLLILLTFSIVVIAFFESLAAYTSTFGMALASVQILTDIRGDLFSHLQRLSLSFHYRQKTGDLMTRVTADIDRIKLTLIKVVLPLATNLITLAGMLIIMLWMNWELAAIALIIFPLFIFFLSRLMSQIRAATREHRQLQGILAATTSETMGAIKVVQALSLEEQFTNIFEQQNQETLHHGTKTLKLSAVLQRMVQILIALAVALVLWRGSHLVIQKTLTAGDLLIFLTYLKNAFDPLRKLSNQFSDIAKSTASAERILDILEDEPHVINLPGAQTAPAFLGSVTFTGVSFGYESGYPTLKDISFRVELGQKIAVVGTSGSGKSTLMGLILRLYDPNTGEISIDGEDIRNYTLDSLRQQISVVLQESILFAATIRENIAYGKVGATDAEIEAAAHLADAHEFIIALPEGYDTLVGERGCTLSGGQRQRIAIARAAIRQAPIIILDEPTTGLDNQSEKAILKSLEELTRHKTTFLISHNLKTVENADLILFIEKGRILERGTHSQLMHQQGYYAALYQLQNAIQGVETYAN